METLIALLKQHSIDTVADVRSQPFSRRFPHFSKDALQADLKTAGIRYVFLGRKLGARREERECYVDGKARYELIAECASFKEGLQRVLKGAAHFRIALMCAEKDPLTCHRAILVSRHLQRLGISIAHILEDGRLESHEEAEQRMMIEEGVNPEQMELFGSGSSADGVVEDAYTKRGEKIAYQDIEPNDEDSHDRIYTEKR